MHPSCGWPFIPVWDECENFEMQSYPAFDLFQWRVRMGCILFSIGLMASF